MSDVVEGPPFGLGHPQESEDEEEDEEDHEDDEHVRTAEFLREKHRRRVWIIERSRSQRVAPSCGIVKYHLCTVRLFEFFLKKDVLF